MHELRKRFFERHGNRIKNKFDGKEESFDIWSSASNAVFWPRCRPKSSYNLTMTTTDAVHTSQRTRKPPLADWPTIKILTPPKGNFPSSSPAKLTLLTGRFSPKTDEWCLTYCSQSITGRIHSKEPFCKSICIRQVFPHEVKNVIAFKNHRNVAPDGKAKYPLPPEGQPANIPRYLGGKSAEDGDARESNVDGPKMWDEGWYLWTSHSRLAIHEKTDTMLMDLEQQRRLAEHWEQRREVWQDYQDHLQNAPHNQDSEEHNTQPSRWWGPIVPPRPVPEFRYVTESRLHVQFNSLWLVHTPFWCRYHPTSLRFGNASVNF